MDRVIPMRHCVHNLLAKRLLDFLEAAHVSDSDTVDSHRPIGPQATA
jgi:hypothetical protein